MKDKSVIIICVIILVVGFVSGYLIGVVHGVNFAVDIGFKYLEAKNISLGVNQDLLKRDINIYKAKIGELN